MVKAVKMVKSNKDCFYLALAIILFKEWGDGAEDTLRTVVPDAYLDRLNRIIQIGKGNVQGI